MDYRCPACAMPQKRRRLAETVITKMEIDCAHCGRRMALNIHRAELFVVLVNFGVIVVLAALAWWLGSERLVLAAIGAAMLGALALPLLEKTWLRSWPRYVAVGPKSCPPAPGEPPAA